MPPLTTPSLAILFMLAFFVVMIGIPFFLARHDHHLTK